MGKKTGSVASNEPSIENLVALKRRTAKAHLAYLKQLVAEGKALLDHDTPQRLKAVQLKRTLEEQLDAPWSVQWVACGTCYTKTEGTKALNCNWVVLNCSVPVVVVIVFCFSFFKWEVIKTI